LPTSAQVINCYDDFVEQITATPRYQAYMARVRASADAGTDVLAHVFLTPREGPAVVMIPVGDAPRTPAEDTRPRKHIDFVLSKACSAEKQSNDRDKRVQQRAKRAASAAVAEATDANAEDSGADDAL